MRGVAEPRWSARSKPRSLL